jgi:hypothetical protein
MQLITLLGAVACLGVLYFRYRNQPMRAPPRTRTQKLATAKILLVAFCAWLALNTALRHLIGNLDGVATPQPTFIQRVISYFSK